MIVIIAGMQRSGSTFIFNVARKLLEASGGVTVITTNNMEEALSKKDRNRNLLIKTHSPDFLMDNLLKNNAIICICSIRKPEDAIASWMRTFGFSFESSVLTIKKWLIWHATMSKYALNINFKEIERTPILTVFRISQYLVHKIEIFKALSIFWQFKKSSVYKKTRKMKKDDSGIVDIGFSYYNELTFFHRRHIFSLKNKSAKDTLSDDQIENIRKELEDFIDTSGNYHW